MPLTNLYEMNSRSTRHFLDARKGVNRSMDWYEFQTNTLFKSQHRTIIERALHSHESRDKYMFKYTCAGWLF